MSEEMLEFKPISKDGCWEKARVEGGFLYHHQSRYLTPGKEVASECAVFVPNVRRKEDGQ